MLALAVVLVGSITWTLCTIALQILWSSMVALQSASTDATLLSSTLTFTTVSWTLFALAMMTTANAVAGVLVVPIVLDGDPLRQQSSIDAALIVCAGTLSVIEIAMALGLQRLSSIAHQQVRFHRDILSPATANVGLIAAMDDLAKRTRHLMLSALSLFPFTLVFLTVVGSYIETRQAARPLRRARARSRVRSARAGTG
jgi:hypothetical protein